MGGLPGQNATCRSGRPGREDFQNLWKIRGGDRRSYRQAKAFGSEGLSDEDFQSTGTFVPVPGINSYGR